MIETMSNPEEQLNALADIRLMMQRSSRFLSLSGLSGVAAGLCALVGAGAVPYYCGIPLFGNISESVIVRSHDELLWFLITDAALVLISALSLGFFFSQRKARRNGERLFGPASLQFTINLAVPLAVGGLFCLLLIVNHASNLVGPATLVFYGITLFSAGKFTLDEVRYLGVCEMILGLLSAWFMGYGLLFWALGFGVLHIVYGLIMWNKYER
jgi:hypothetical protein